MIYPTDALITARASNDTGLPVNANTQKNEV